MEKRFLYILILLFLFVSESLAQYHWDKMNLPDTLRCRSICFMDEAVFIGTDNGVILTDLTFTGFEHLGLQNLFVTSIISTTNNVLFAGGGTVLWRYDSIQGWEEIINIGQYIDCFHESPNGNLFFGSWGSIYRSIDNGDTWHQVWDMGNAHGVNDITENSDGVLFAGTKSFGSDTSGLYNSIDDGATWNLISLENNFVFSIVCNNYDTLYVGYDKYWDRGIYKSNDITGQMWTSVFENNLVYDLALSIENRLIAGCSSDGAYGGVYISYNDGDTWEDISGDLPSRNTDMVKIDVNDYLYKCGYLSGDLYRLSDPITSTSEFTFDTKLSFFPNPTIDELVIENQEEAFIIITIYNISGHIVYSNISHSLLCCRHKINVSNFESGIYFVKVESENQTVIEKVIKK